MQLSCVILHLNCTAQILRRTTVREGLLVLENLLLDRHMRPAKFCWLGLEAHLYENPSFLLIQRGVVEIRSQMLLPPASIKSIQKVLGS